MSGSFSGSPTGVCARRRGGEESTAIRVVWMGVIGFDFRQESVREERKGEGGWKGEWVEEMR